MSRRLYLSERCCVAELSQITLAPATLYGMLRIASSAWVAKLGANVSDFVRAATCLVGLRRSLARYRVEFVGKFAGIEHAHNVQLSTAQPRRGQRLVAKGTPGMYPDGDGLYLSISRDGTASWVLRYMFGGKSPEMGLGPVR